MNITYSLKEIPGALNVKISDSTSKKFDGNSLKVASKDLYAVDCLAEYYQCNIILPKNDVVAYISFFLEENNDTLLLVHIPMLGILISAPGFVDYKYSSLLYGLYLALRYTPSNIPLTISYSLNGRKINNILNEEVLSVDFQYTSGFNKYVRNLMKDRDVRFTTSKWIYDSEIPKMFKKGSDVDLLFIDYYESEKSHINPFSVLNHYTVLEREDYTEFKDFLSPVEAEVLADNVMNQYSLPMIYDTVKAIAKMVNKEDYETTYIDAFEHKKKKIGSGFIYIPTLKLRKDSAYLSSNGSLILPKRETVMEVDSDEIVLLDINFKS